MFTFTRTGSTAAAIVVTVSTDRPRRQPAGPARQFIGWFVQRHDRTVTFAAGSLDGDVDLGVVDDSLVEGAETLIFTVQSGSGYTVGSPASGTGTIADNETPPDSADSDGSSDDRDGGQQRRTGRHGDGDRDATGGLSGASTVNWSTSPGTAVAGSRLHRCLRGH